MMWGIPAFIICSSEARACKRGHTKASRAPITQRTSLFRTRAPEPTQHQNYIKNTSNFERVLASRRRAALLQYYPNDNTTAWLLNYRESTFLRYSLKKIFHDLELFI